MDTKPAPDGLSGKQEPGTAGNRGESPERRDQMTPQQRKTRWINAWKRRNNRKTRMGSRLMYAYNVPGTRERGQLEMWEAQHAELFNPEPART